MRRNLRRRIVCLALVVLAAFGGEMHAEISAEPGLTEVGVLVLGVIEGPDPIPQIIWEPVRDIDPVLILNAEGAGRGDGRPDIVIDLLNEKKLTFPCVVDPSQAAMRTWMEHYKSRAVPTSYMIDREGTIVAAWLGYDEQHHPAIEELRGLGIVD